MGRNKTVGVLTAHGVDEFSVPRSSGGRVAVLVGFTQKPWIEPAEVVANRERIEIARTYARLGCDVYRTIYNPHRRVSRANRPMNGWPNDLYVEAGGIFIPAEGAFTDLGRGGFYVFGEDFVLVSAEIEEAFRRQMRNHPGFRRAFRGRKIHFITPYVLRLPKRGRIKRIPCGHIDLTIGCVPGRRLLTIADLHYATVASSIRAIARQHGLRVQVTTIDPPMTYHAFVNNYFVLNPGRRNQVVVANRYERFDRLLRAAGVVVRSPRLPVTRLPIFRGSIKCVSNQAPSARVFDRLGIAYQPF